jgi:hypothetical protein
VNAVVPVTGTATENARPSAPSAALATDAAALAAAPAGLISTLRPGCAGSTEPLSITVPPPGGNAAGVAESVTSASVEPTVLAPAGVGAPAVWATAV